MTNKQQTSAARIVAAVVFSGIALAGCESNQTKLGGGSTMGTGSGGAAGTQGASTQLIRCARPIGTAALLEPNYASYAGYGLTSPVPLVRLMMAQSRCFRVVDRGRASAALQRERAMAAGGQFQKNSNMGSGQMVAADYLITPSITHRDADSGGGFGGLGGYIPGIPGILAGGLRTSNLEAQVLLSATSVRTGVQEAIAEGSASKRDIDFAGVGWLGVVAGVGGAYEDTDIGKIVAAAFLDAHNKLVTQLGAIPVGSAQRANNAGYMTTARVNLRAGPSTRATVLTSVPKGTPVSHAGAMVGGWWEVDVNGRQGWIHSNYIAR